MGTSAEHFDLHVTVRESAGGPRHRLQVALATSTSDIHAAQRLRHRVFGEEMGATLSSRAPGRDEDIFDAWCEHLIVRDCNSGNVVGTYRLLTAERARRLGTFYADGEFDLTRLSHLKPRMVEIGRDGMDTARPPGMKGWEMDERALQDRTASMCQSGVATQPLEERRARNECYDIWLGRCKASVPDVLGRRPNG